MELYVHFCVQLLEPVNILERHSDASHVVIPAAAILVPDRDDQALLGDVLEDVCVCLEDKLLLENRIQVLVLRLCLLMAVFVDDPLLLVPFVDYPLLLVPLLVNQEDVRIGVLASLPSNIMGGMKVDNKFSVREVEADFDSTHVLASEDSGSFHVLVLSTDLPLPSTLGMY